ncbi:MAG: hypothetical protein JXA54_06490 [Candidatus Heimdallarchaeota archaeon]|nr:hypothetical protein [Candidatus Heimdallarchaeota archaeon]
MVIIDSPVDYRHAIFWEDGHNSLPLKNCYRVPINPVTKEPDDVEKVIGY